MRNVRPSFDKRYSLCKYERIFLLPVRLVFKRIFSYLSAYHERRIDLHRTVCAGIEILGFPVGKNRLISSAVSFKRRESGRNHLFTANKISVRTARLVKIVRERVHVFISPARITRPMIVDDYAVFPAVKHRDFGESRRFDRIRIAAFFSVVNKILSFPLYRRKFAFRFFEHELSATHFSVCSEILSYNVARKRVCQRAKKHTLMMSHMRRNSILPRRKIYCFVKSHVAVRAAFPEFFQIFY